MSEKIEDKSKQIVRIFYTNWRKESNWRRIIPIRIEFASTSWHPEPQWLLVAYDCDKLAERSFAVRDIHRWEVPNTEAHYPG